MAPPPSPSLHSGSLEEAIENASKDVFKRAKHRAPAKLAKAVRIATQAFGDVHRETLRLALQSPDALEGALEEAIRRTARSGAAAGGGGKLSSKTPEVLGRNDTFARISETDAERWLEEVSRPIGPDDADYITLSTMEAAERLDTTRATISAWIKSGKVLAFEGAKRGWRVPAAQIRRKKLAPGLKEVQKQFDDAELAWHFLVHEQVYAGNPTTALDMLFQRKLADVIALAEGYGSDFL